MKPVFLFGFALVCGGVANLAFAEALAAQAACAQCTDCETCRRSDWGASRCNFKGTKDGKPCCRLVGDICNPAMFLAEEDIGFVPRRGGAVAAARLEADVFGSWGCDNGALRAAYRRTAGGAWNEVTGAELAALREKYTLTRYIEMAKQRVRDKLLRRSQAGSRAPLVRS